MKVQCSCGAKYDFAISPDMANRPVKFICTACGLDSTDFVTRLVHQELEQSAAAVPAHGPSPAAPVGTLLDSPAAQTPPSTRLRIQVASAPSPETRASTAEPEGEPVCLKHSEYATQRCYICKKPICPKCMELFGYVCSPLCRAKANSHGIRVPVYEGQRTVIEARLWQKVLRVSALAAGVVVLLIAFWIWYAWFGSLPKPVYSFRFTDPSYSGESVICGKGNQEIVFLHGSVLARHDMKAKKEIWSRDLVDHKQVGVEAAQELAEVQADHNRIQQENPEALSYGRFKMPSLTTLSNRLEKWRAASLELYVRGQNIWVAFSGDPAQVVRYDWDTGNTLKEIPFKADYSQFHLVGDELLVEQETFLQKSKVMTYVNLNTCDSRVEEIGTPEALAATNPSGGANASHGIAPWARNPRDSQGAGLPIGMPGKDIDKPMDPARVSEQVRHLPLPARIALPAVLAGNISQERALSEMADDNKPSRQQIAVKKDPGEQVTFLPSKDGYIRVGVRMVKAQVAVRSGMKTASGKSVLDGNLTAGNTLEASEQILNELQRSRGGGNVYENVSTYHVRLGKPDEPEQWSGDLSGPPSLFPLQTVNVVAANKSILVFSKTNKKLWQATLTYDVGEDWGALEPAESLYGQGPCVEHQGVLYLFDEGVLTAFDLNNGNVRWRLPSVGIIGMFFDEKGCMYVNTTTANLDRIKYPMQISLSSRINDVVLKIDCRNGKILWSAEPGGLVNYVSGKFLYVVREYQPYEPDDDEDPGMEALGANDQPYLRIRRLNPGSGTEMWEHFEPRCPLDIQFDKNVIRLVFKKEVKVMKFLTF